ncbi:MAG: hypothetical protein RIR88_911 [Actinomycetota bacterium]
MVDSGDESSANVQPAPVKHGFSALALGEHVSGQPHPLLRAMGGVLGIFETLVPGFVFIAVFAVTTNSWLAIAISVAVSVLFTLYRLVRRQAPTQALVGLAGVVASAVLAVMSQKPEDNFVVGLWTNLAYGVVFLVSAIVRWPLIGVAVNLVRGDGVAWRRDRHMLRVFTGVTLLWVALFAIRLAVEWPLYLAADIAGLGIAKLVLGLPLYVPVLAATWLIIRSMYRENRAENEQDIS